mgnify:CR=1 FL=1
MYLYDLYDADREEMVIYGKKQKEIQDFFGKKINCSEYSDKMLTAIHTNGHRYKIVKCGGTFTKRKPKKKDYKLNATRFREEWLEMQQMFKGVKWKKNWEPGVKEL